MGYDHCSEGFVQSRPPAIRPALLRFGSSLVWTPSLALALFYFLHIWEWVGCRPKRVHFLLRSAAHATSYGASIGYIDPFLPTPTYTQQKLPTFGSRFVTLKKKKTQLQGSFSRFAGLVDDLRRQSLLLGWFGSSRTRWCGYIFGNLRYHVPWEEIGWIFFG